MPWVRFIERFSWDPPERRGRTTIVFPTGTVRFVRRACAEAALVKGAAVPATRPEDPK